MTDAALTRKITPKNKVVCPSTEEAKIGGDVSNKSIKEVKF
jgi:hypothetical protein